MGDDDDSDDEEDNMDGMGSQLGWEGWDEDDGVDEDVIVIIDNGTGMCKAGLSSDREPAHIFPEVVGRAREGQPLSRQRAELEEEWYFSNQALELSNDLKVRWPVENGIISHFEHMEHLWNYTYLEKLEVNPTRHPILLTEPPYNPNSNREEMVEIMFEVFCVPQLNISIQGVLALLGQGRTTGLVLDCGEGGSHTIPIFQGYGLPHCINRMEVAGKDITSSLGKLLAQSNCKFTKSGYFLALQAMKEEHCYLSLDPGREHADEKEVTLPDGTSFGLKDERWKATESLFNPQTAGLDPESNGVAGMIWDSIMSSELDTRRSLLANVVLSGGSTLIPGFVERLEKELRFYAPPTAAVRILKCPDPRNAVWLGGQVFASLPLLHGDQWMSKEEYEEFGASLIHDKVLFTYS